MDNPRVYSVILAGGEGRRFAPLSTPELPKQFLKILDPKKTLIQQTYARVSAFTARENIFVSTSAKYLHLVATQLPKLEASHIIGEPEKKNTAPAMALLTRVVFEVNPESIVFFFPADHYIRSPDKAYSVYSKAIRLASREEVLITFGIIPDYPSPEHGYIQIGGPVHKKNGYRVTSFKEKPDVQRAKEYLATGDYYWNSGIFCWNSRFFLKELNKYMPALSNELKLIGFTKDRCIEHEWLVHYFKTADSISIDYAIMEKTSAAVILPMNAGWSDVGTWKGLGELAQKYRLNLPSEIVKHLELQGFEYPLQP